MNAQLRGATYIVPMLKLVDIGRLVFLTISLIVFPLLKAFGSSYQFEEKSGLHGRDVANLNQSKYIKSDTRVTLNHIELFAGCGGLSLGLESEGYELVFANELSPMAGETFAYNLLGESGEDLQECIKQNKKAQHTFWLHSKYSAENLKDRLRENPREFLPLDDENSHNDLKGKGRELKGGLVIADIIRLNEYLERDQDLLKQVRVAFSRSCDGRVDLVSGGPPCQSFSMAGLRQFKNERNRLPWEFAKFVGLVKPRAVILENVSGILNAFNDDDRKVYAWFEVAKAFAVQGYVPICLHVNAKYAGAAQNRPRFIMLALEQDVFEKYSAIGDHSEATNTILTKAHELYQATKSNPNLAYDGKRFKYFDIEDDSEMFQQSFLKDFICKDKGEFYTIKDAIDDLRQTGGKVSSSPYITKDVNGLIAKQWL